MPRFRAPDGSIVNVSEEQSGALLAGGYEPVNLSEASHATADLRPETSGVLAPLGAAASSALSGATLGLSDLALKGVLSPESFQRLAADREAHPFVSGAGQLAGALVGGPTPAGALNEATAAASAGRGAVARIAADAAAGSVYSAGAYLSDSALSDRELSAEGLRAALGAGFEFGAAGGAAALGIEKGTIAARRLFSRLSDGTERVANEAEQAWRAQHQATFEANDAAAELARAKLAEANLTRQQAQLAQQRAAAGAADARLPQPSAPFEAPAGVPSEGGVASSAPARVPDVAPQPPLDERIAGVLNDRAHVGLQPGVADPRASMLDQQAAELLSQRSGEATQVTGPSFKPGDPGFRFDYSTRGGNALDLLAEQPGVVTRGPAELGRVPGSLTPEAEAELTAALREHDGARAELDDLFARLEAPSVQSPAIPVPVGEFGAPGARGFKSQNELARLAAGTGREDGAIASLEDVTGAGGPRALRGGAKGTPVEPAAAGGRTATTDPIRLQGTPAVAPVARVTMKDGARTAHLPDGSQRGLGLHQIEGFAKEQLPHGWDPFGIVLNEDFAILRGLPHDLAGLEKNSLNVVSPSELAERAVSARTAPERAVREVIDAWKKGERVDSVVAYLTPDSAIHVVDGEAQLQAALREHRDIPIRLRDGREFRTLEDAQQLFAGKPHGSGVAPGAPGFKSQDEFARLRGGAAEVPEYSAVKAHEAKADAALEQTISAREIADRGYYEPPVRGGGTLEEADPVRMAKARKAIAEGQREPVDLNVTPSGKVTVTGGRHRLQAAIEADAPIKVRWSTSAEPAADDVLRHGRQLESESATPKTNPKRVEAAKKAAAASLERRREIHSAVASNLPQELQLAWDKEGYKFLQEEAVRIRGKKDPISAASNISEAFAEKYGSASETGRGYEGDRYHRRQDIEAKHAESWAKEQGRKHNKQAVREESARISDQADRLALLAEQSKRPIDDLTELFEERAAIHEFDGGKGRVDAERAALDDVADSMRKTSGHAVAGEATDTLTGQLRGMQAKLGAGDSLVEMGAPAREAYLAAKAERTTEAATHFRGRAIAAREARAGAVAAGETPNPFHELAGGPEMDQFFRNLTAPKTRDAYVAANIGRAMREEGSHAAGLARLEREWQARGSAAAPQTWREFQASKMAEYMRSEGGHAGAMKRMGKEWGEIKAVRDQGVRKLEQAHDAAAERAATAVDPAERAAAIQEAQAIEQQLTASGVHPGAVEDVAAVAPVVTRYERAGARLADALGEEAPPAAKEAAQAFRAAEDAADRKTIDRATRAIDDHVEGARSGKRGPAERTVVDKAPPVDERPVTSAADWNDQRVKQGLGDALAAPRTGEAANPRVVAAKAAKLRADAGLAHARAAETEAKIGATTTKRTAAEYRAAAEAGRPVGAAPAESSKLGSVLTAVAAAGEIGIPGIPHPKDIPVIGPLLSLWTKYRIAKAMVGRFSGRVAATGDARAAAFAARAKDKVAAAVDRTLGLAAEVAPKARGPIVATAAVLGHRLIDDGEPDAPKGANAQELAAVRIREIAAAASRPDLVVSMVRRQLGGVTDPDLIAAAEQVLQQQFQRLAGVMPKLPPPNPYAKTQFVPSPAAAADLADRIGVMHDPSSAFDSPTPAKADALANFYPKLFAVAQQRLAERAAELKEPMTNRQQLVASLIFRVPVATSMEPGRLAVLQSAHVALRTAMQPTQQPDSPPTPAVAQPTNLNSMYQTSADRRAARM